MGKIEVLDERFTFIHVDVVGPLPESEDKKYLLSVLDRTSKWLECFPMANTTSEGIMPPVRQLNSDYKFIYSGISAMGMNFCFYRTLKFT